MTNPIFDFEDSSFAFPISDQFAISANGKPLMRLNDNIAVDINTGKPHFTIGWTRDDEKDSAQNGNNSQ